MNALEEKVLELIGENVDSPDVFTDGSDAFQQVRDSLNDAVQEIVMLTGGNKRQYFLPLRSGIGFYRLKLSGDLGWITDVWSVNRNQRLTQTDLVRLSNLNPRWMIDSSDPWEYLPVGNDIIGFHPKPSSDTDVMELTLVEIPAPYESDRDRVKLRGSLQYGAVEYAVSEYWASRGDALEAATHHQRYLSAVGITQAFNPQAEHPAKFESRKQ